MKIFISKIKNNLNAIIYCIGIICVIFVMIANNHGAFNEKNDTNNLNDNNIQFVEEVKEEINKPKPVTQEISEEVFKILHEYDYINFVKSYSTGNVLRYELTYDNLSKNYSKERNIIEQEMLAIYYDINEAFHKYESKYDAISISVFDPNNMERTLFVIEDGMITFTVLSISEMYKDGDTYYSKEEWNLLAARY